MAFARKFTSPGTLLSKDFELLCEARNAFVPRHVGQVQHSNRWKASEYSESRIVEIVDTAPPLG